VNGTGIRQNTIKIKKKWKTTGREALKIQKKSEYSFKNE